MPEWTIVQQRAASCRVRKITAFNPECDVYAHKGELMAEARREYSLMAEIAQLCL